MKSIEEIMQKDAPEFVTEVAHLNGDQLHKRIVKLAQYFEETSKAKQDDVELTDSKEKVKLLAGPYNDTMKMIRKKMKYIFHLLESRGVTKE